MYLSVIFLITTIVVSSSSTCLFEGGLYCSEDCTSVLKCIAGHEIVVNKCSSDWSQYCNVLNKDCSSEGKRGACVPMSAIENKNDNSTVICQHSEAMPHPTDCTKYFECPGQILRSCSRGSSFNQRTKICDENLGSDFCQKGYTMEECGMENIGNATTLEDNPNIIQVCIYNETYRIALIQCPEKQIWDEISNTCKD